MEDKHKQEHNSLKINFLARLTEVFSSQMDSIILAVELLKYSDYTWNESEKFYLDFVKNYALKMIELIKDKTIIINPNEEDLRYRLDCYGLAWWVEIKTVKPCMTYYFGPFTSAREAELAQSSYIEALEHKGDRIQCIRVQQYQPASLSIFKPNLAENYKIDPSFNPELN